MHYITTLCLCGLFASTCSRKVNYCGSRMCDNTDLHTFCQFPPGPSPSCTGYFDAPLRQDEKSRLLERLNQRRNEAAQGQLRGMPSAGNMLKLRWIEELAREAQLWADQCRPPSSPEEHDQCRDLYSTSVGQCVASVVGEAPGLRVESMVDMWYMQSLLYKGNVSSYVPPENARYYYGDFGQIMWAPSYTVGCARSRFMIQWKGRFQTIERLVCNLSPAGPVPYRALWGAGVPASACPPRSLPDQAFTALCNYQFKIDESVVVEGKMTIEENALVNSVLEIEGNESIFGHGSLDKLYLTNLAIVTINDIESSTIYNSIQKRAVIDVKNYTVNARDMHTELKTTRKVPDYPKTPKVPDKKINMIGRPKTYNMEELTEIGDDHKENNYEITEDVLKKIDDIYGDYNIVEEQDNNETTVTEATRIQQSTNLIENAQTIDLRKSAIAFADTMYDNNFSNETVNKSTLTMDEIVTYVTETIYIAANGTELDVLTEPSFTNADLLNETFKSNEKSVEDYLTDPETVRQLQQALDRMENKMQTSKITEKVPRRFSKSVEDSSTTNILSNFLSEEERKKTMDKPVLDMMLKYMPYMKQYQGQILGNANSAGLCPSVVLVSSFTFGCLIS